MWLASVSIVSPITIMASNGLLPTHLWGSRRKLEAESIIDELLDGQGDEARERSFRMDTTLCRHRAITQEENEALPDWFKSGKAQHIAAAPVEILWSTEAMPSPITMQPCQNQSLVKECGACPPCKARAVLEEGLA